MSKITKTGLILEGGGMRGVFTAGILDFFIEKGLEFDTCFGVSAGACMVIFLNKKAEGITHLLIIWITRNTVE